MLAVSLTAVTIIFAVESETHGWRAYDAFAALLTVAVNLPVALRRRWPWPVLLVSSSALACYLAAGFPPSENLWAPMLALYTVLVCRPPRAAPVAAALVGTLWVWAGFASRTTGEVAFGQATIGVGVVWAFGARMRESAELNDRLALLAEELRREQAARAHHAVTEERLRIAPELHDVVAHHMTVGSVQAGLARYVFERDPDTASAALDTIGTSIHEALEEMRGLLELLRVRAPEPSAPHRVCGPAPGTERLSELAARMRAAGLLVEMSVTGSPYPLPTGADLAVYRIVQESLTNVLKHAGPVKVQVLLHYGPQGLIGWIIDDGTGTGVTDPIGPGGHGTVGMQERVHLYGGTLHAGHRSGGGYQVVFTLPAQAPDGSPGPGRGDPAD